MFFAGIAKERDDRLMQTWQWNNPDKTPNGHEEEFQRYPGDEMEQTGLEPKSIPELLEDMTRRMPQARAQLKQPEQRHREMKQWKPGMALPLGTVNLAYNPKLAPNDADMKRKWDEMGAVFQKKQKFIQKSFDATGSYFTTNFVLEIKFQ
jgi:hypothetical protein